MKYFLINWYSLIRKIFHIDIPNQTHIYSFLGHLVYFIFPLQELWYTLSPILTRKSKRTCKRSSSPILKSIQQLQAGTGSCIDIFNESQKETSPVIDVNSSPKQCGSSSPVFRSKSLKPRSVPNSRLFFSI